MNEAAYRAVEDMVWSVTLDLGLRDPGETPIIPVELASRASMRAVAKKGCDGLYYIYLDKVQVADHLSAARAAYVVGHELRHAWQYRHWTPAMLDDTPLLEADADAYAYEAMHRFFRWERYAPGHAPAGAHAAVPRSVEARSLTWLRAA